MKIMKPVPDGTGWVAIPNATARDTRLDRRALGLLVEILSFPDGWEMNADSLATDGAEGRNAVRAAMRKLEDAGYIVHIRHRGDRGRWLTAAFAGNSPAAARAAADAWLEQNPDAVEQQTPRSDRGTENGASANGASVEGASVNGLSANRAFYERRKPKTVPKKGSNTDPPASPALSPSRPSRSARTDTVAPGDEERETPPLQPPQPDPVSDVVDAWAKSRVRAGTPATLSERIRVGTGAAELLAAGHTVGYLAQVASWMGFEHPGWSDLGRARTASGAPPLAPDHGQTLPAPRRERPACVTNACDGCDHDECNRNGFLVDADTGVRCPCWFVPEARF